MRLDQQAAMSLCVRELGQNACREGSAAPLCGVGWRQWFADDFSYLIKEFGREIRVI